LVYVADLLVVMTDRLKIVRIHARNVPRACTRTQALDDDASPTSLTDEESDGKYSRSDVRVLDAPGHYPAESLRTTYAGLAVASIVIIISKQESCRDSTPSSL